MNVREWALPVYTILLQLATGALLILWLIRSSSLKVVGGAGMDKILRRPVLVIFVTMLAALIGAHFHLSNPLMSFIAVLNIGRSWLSREIFFNILFFFACAALVDLVWTANGARQRLKTALGWIGILLGGASIYCMASIYLLPTQAPWNNGITILLFFCSSILLGATSVAALLIMDAIFSQEFEPDLAEDRRIILNRFFKTLAALAAISMLLIVTLNIVQLAESNKGDPLVRVSLSLLLGLYQPLLAIRFVVLFIGVGIFLLIAYWLLKKGRALGRLVTPVYLACLLALVAEILGRFLFYASHVRLGI